MKKIMSLILSLMVIVSVYGNAEVFAVDETTPPGLTKIHHVFEDGYSATAAWGILSYVGLCNYAEIVNSGDLSWSGYGVLLNDIEVNEKYDVAGYDGTQDTTGWEKWTPINLRKYFDGNGYTISGIFCVGEDYAGLFGDCHGVNIKNLTLKNSYIKANSEGFAGGICAYPGAGMSKPKISNCHNYATVMAEKGNGAYVGGITGGCNRITITDCTNYGKVYADAGDYGYVGGIIGEGLSVNNCHNKGDVSGDSCVGGVAGTGSYVSNCSNSGKITGCGDYIGGVVGNSGDAEDCYNTGDVSGNTKVGGITGFADRGTLRCYNTGNITGLQRVGGIAGARYAGEGVHNSYNLGDITGEDCVAGIAGSGTGGVANCFNMGIITGNTNVDYLAADTGVTRNVQNCYYLSDVDDKEAKTKEQFESGEIAALLHITSWEGTVWGQEIGTDEHPVLGGYKVHKTGNSYSNYATIGYTGQTATVAVKKAGEYTVVFADYNGNKLQNVDIVVLEAERGGEFLVEQKNKTFVLGNGDKVMILQDISTITPKCGVFVL